jgi:two-component system sensor histidine kinase RegB
MRSNFGWLVRLRWAAIGSQLLTLLVVQFGLGIALPWASMGALVALAALSNVLCELWSRSGRAMRDSGIATVMALDYLILTGLLYEAGGPSNPFSALYLVHVALAAAILRPAHAWALAGLSTALFGLLFLLPARHDAVVHAMGMHDHAAVGSMGLHFQGMWVAFAIAALVIVYFVTRVAQDLEQQRQAVAEARARALRSEKLAALATLSAGAAHELGTPLSTIAVAAGELEHSFARVLADAEATLEVQTIRAEVERCRHILAQLSSDAGEQMGEAFDQLSCAELIEHALEPMRERTRVQVSLAENAPSLRVPRRALAQALRALVKNALEASTGEVRVSLSARAGLVLAEVRDQGAGMSEDVLDHVGEPFFTTKLSGHGMGLGVFLARSVFERLGGELRYDSQRDAGTCARASFRAEGRVWLEDEQAGEKS